MHQCVELEQQCYRLIGILGTNDMIFTVFFSFTQW